MKDKRGPWNKLSASGQQDNVFEKFQRPGAAAVLVVDFAVHVIRVGQVNQLGARFKVTIVPAGQPQATRSARFRFRHSVQVQKHELARVKTKAVIEERRVHGAAERHELRFNPHEMRNCAHGVKHFLEEPPSQGFLRKFARDIQATDQPFLLFQDIEGISGRGAVLERRTTGEGARFHKALDQLQSAAVVPMQLIAPVPYLFLEKRLDLTHGGLPQVDDIHGYADLVSPRHAASIIADSRRPGLNRGGLRDTNPTQGYRLPRVPAKGCATMAFVKSLYQ